MSGLNHSSTVRSSPLPAEIEALLQLLPRDHPASDQHLAQGPELDVAGDGVPGHFHHHPRHRAQLLALAQLSGSFLNTTGGVQFSYGRGRGRGRWPGG